MRTDHSTCGAARGLITPAAALIPNLRALRDDSFGGVLDDLYLRVIAVGQGESKALIIGFDLDKALHPAENLAVISERTGIPQENILYFSTHTHTAPVTGSRPEESINDVSLKVPEVQAAQAEYERQVIGTLLRVVDEAIADMRPARMGYACGESYINVNRNQVYEWIDERGEVHRECALGANPETPTDRSLFVLRFEDLDGKPIAFFMNYPVHSCVMIGNDCCDGKIGIGGDLSGCVCRGVEGRYPGSVAVWSSGAAGDVNPLLMNEIFYPDHKTGRPALCRLGDGAPAVLATLAGRHLADILKVIRTIECRVDSAPIAGTVAWSFTPGRDIMEQGDGTQEMVGEGVDPYEIRLHLVKMGDVALFGFSGELYSSLGAHIKEISPLENTVLINHDATLIARSHYIFDDEALVCNTCGVLPGRGNSHMLPGYVLASLEKLTLEMFKELGSS